MQPDLARLAEYLREDATAILTGAGISTESGIPDYRGPTGTLRNRLPIRYQEFVKSAETRRRYWARSAVGYPRLKSACPNAGHVAVACLPDLVPITGLITQNVDGLHQAAGSRTPVELHGNLRQVICLSCGAMESRDGYQERLHALNRSWTGWDEDSWEEAPDGDARLPEAAAEAFVVPDCRVCGGPTKPNVVFFGESVPKARVEEAFAIVRAAGNLLVLGSSLYVFSGFRFARAAHQAGARVVIINDGKTRADDLADIKMPAALGDTLEELSKKLQIR